MWTCKYCKKIFDYNRTSEKGNHVKYCEADPRYQKRMLLKSERQKNALAKFYGEVKQFEVSCFVCQKLCIVEEKENLFLRRTKKKYYCNSSCRNSIGGKAKSAKYHNDDQCNYTTLAWRYHKKECVVCGEKNVVAVHHYNENHDDNDVKNLVPLCPTHHIYVHSKYKYLIENQINYYVRHNVPSKKEI